MMNFPILSTIILLPLLTSLYIMFFVTQSIKADKTIYIKYAAALSAALSFIASILLIAKFDHSNEAFQFVEKMQWVNSIGLEYHIGVDGISIMFIALTTLLTLICILVSLFTVKKYVKEYILCLLITEFCILGFFCSINLLLLYIFFEAMLIPMYLMIGIWGGENKIYAALQFFIYTFFGSIFFLISLIVIYQYTATFDIELLKLKMLAIPMNTSKILWLGIFIALAIKVPMFPFHTWLPNAHVEAPTTGSIILAGILLKIGGYGFLRILLPLFVNASMFFAPYVIILSVIAIIYASLVAYAQSDMKKMIAYSSISHMGYVTAGIFSFNATGVIGAIFQMLSHGIISAGLFLIVGLLYERHHTKEIDRYGGVASVMPILAVCFMICVLGSIGLPGTSGFIGEFLSLAGLFVHFPYASILSTSGIIIGALYMLRLYKLVMLGGVKIEAIASFKDLSKIEMISLFPLMGLIVYLGICPETIMQFIRISRYII